MQQPVLQYQAPVPRRRGYVWLSVSLSLITVAIYLLRDIETIEERTAGNYDTTILIGDTAAAFVRSALIFLVITWCGLLGVLIRRLITRRPHNHLKEKRAA